MSDKHEIVLAIHYLARELYLQTAVVGTHKIDLKVTEYDYSGKHMSEIYNIISKLHSNLDTLVNHLGN